MTDNKLRETLKTLGPLGGVRIIALTRATAGPYCALWLANLGAEIIQVEDPAEPREQISQVIYKNMDAHYMCLHRNQKCINLDLKQCRGKEVFRALLEKSDVLLDNFRPGVMERLGLGYETLKLINPRLISCSVTSYGLSGPGCKRPGFDSTIQAASGRLSLTWEKGHLPIRSPGLADLASAMAGAYGITAALYERERTGLGQKVDVSSLDVQVFMLTGYAQEYLISGRVRENQGEQDPNSAGFGTLRTLDGCIAIAARRQKFWVSLCEAIGLKDLLCDPRLGTPNKRAKNGEEVWGILNKVFRTKTTQEWLDILTPAGVPCEPVNTIDKALADPQLLYRNMVMPVDDRHGGQVRMLGNPVKMSSIPADIVEYPHEKGEDTKAVLGGILDYSPEQIDQLKKDKAI